MAPTKGLLMKMLRLLCCLSLIAVFLAEVPQAAEPVVLQYKMSPGDRLVYRITGELSQTPSANGVPVGASTSTATTEVVVWTIERIDDAGNFHIRSENKRLRLKMNMGSTDFEYDSAKPKEAEEEDGKFAVMLSSMGDALSGATKTFVMTPRGEIKEAEIKGRAGEMAEMMGEMGTAMLNSFAGVKEEEGGERPRSPGTQEFLILPENPVQPGDTWTAAQELEHSAVDMVGERVFRYDGPDQVDGRPTVRIDVRHEQTVEIDMGEIGKLTLSTDSSSGTAHFSPGEGHLISLDTSHTLSGTMPVEIGGLSIEKTRKATVELLDELPE